MPNHSQHGTGQTSNKTLEKYRRQLIAGYKELILSLGGRAEHRLRHMIEDDLDLFGIETRAANKTNPEKLFRAENEIGDILCSELRVLAREKGPEALTDDQRVLLTGVRRLQRGYLFALDPAEMNQHRAVLTRSESLLDVAELDRALVKLEVAGVLKRFDGDVEGDMVRISD